MPRTSGAVVIATLNRAAGDTGVHTHTRALRDGLTCAGLRCDVVGPFTSGPGRRAAWAPVFAVRPLVLKRVNRDWATRWYRHWHAAALRGNLTRHLRVLAGAGRGGGAAGALRAVVAQCPVSAAVAMGVRERLGLDYPVTLVCHFNHSEAREYRERGELPDEASYRRMLAYEEDVLRRADTVVYVSDWARRVVEEERGIRPRASRVVWNGIDAAAPVASDAAARCNARAAVGLGDDDLVLINAGTLEPRKNQIGLVDLFTRVLKETPTARLVLVGDGPQRSAIERRVEDLELRDATRLLGMRRDVPALLAAADVYVHFATAENCPVVLLEAARAGLPVAAIPAGGVPEILSRLGGGPDGKPLTLELDPLDADRSLRVLHPLLRDTALRRDFGRRARENFDAHFTRDAMVKGYLSVLGIDPAPREEDHPWTP